MKTPKITNEQKWRLILGVKKETIPQKNNSQSGGGHLSEEYRKMDDVLTTLYNDNAGAGNKPSRPKIHRWLGDLRTYFNSETVIILQKDAIHRYDMEWLLFEPEILDEMEPSVDLVATLLSLQKTMPEESRESARQIIKEVVKKITIENGPNLKKSARAALSRSRTTQTKRIQDIDWRRTIHYNLKHYQPDYNTIIPEKIFSNQRKEKITKELFICLDQSASMSSSVIYSSIYACVLAHIPSLKTHLYLFDTDVYDVSDQLDDPVNLLFGVNLGGGTRIRHTLKYVDQDISRNKKSMVLLISDLEENSSKGGVLDQFERLVKSGVQCLVLLSLSDDGTPRYNADLAQGIRNLDIPVFSSTPSSFPALISQYL